MHPHRVSPRCEDTSGPVRFAVFMTNPVGRLRIEIDLRRRTTATPTGPRPAASHSCMQHRDALLRYVAGRARC